MLEVGGRLIKLGCWFYDDNRSGPLGDRHKGSGVPPGDGRSAAHAKADGGAYEAIVNIANYYSAFRLDKACTRLVVLQALHVAERGSQHLVKTVHSTITNDYQKHTVSATHGGAKTTMRKGWTSGAAAMTRRVTWRRVNHGSARCGGGAATALAHGAIRPGGPWRNLAEPIDRGSAAARASGARVMARHAGCRAATAGCGADGRGAGGRLSLWWTDAGTAAQGKLVGAHVGAWTGRAVGRAGMGETRGTPWTGGRSHVLKPEEARRDEGAGRR